MAAFQGIEVALFKYTAKDANPKSKTYRQEVKGFIKAKNAARAENELLKKTLIPRTMVEVGENLKVLSFKSIRIDETLQFTRQMWTLLESGCDILDSLHTCSKMTTNQVLRKQLTTAYKKVETGIPTSQHFTKNKRFDPIISEMLRVGETTGSLDNAFKMLTYHFEFKQDNERKVKEALAQPKQTIGMIVVILTLMMIFVIPTLLGGITNGVEIPVPTKIVLWVSDVLRNDFHYIALVIFNLFVANKIWTDKYNGKLFKDTHFHKIPVIGTIKQKYEMIIFSRTMAMMFRAGIPINETFELAANTTDNEYLKRQALVMKDHVEGGLSISVAATRANMFPLLVETMLQVGDKTGRVDTTLDSVAVYYKREIDHDLKRLQENIKPFVLFFCGGLVLLIVLAIYLPMLASLVSIIK